MKKLLVFAILSGLISALALSCGDGGGSGTRSESGTVALYGTDSLAGYEAVEAIINAVALVHTGSGDACTVAEYQDVDITELSSVLEFLGAADCPSRSYNRFRLVFEEEVVLTDDQDVTATCVFDTYKDSKGQPNKLFCESGLCTVEINGAVNVLASSAGVTGLDFDLKEFEVTNFPAQDCTVTMKTSPISASDMAGLPRVVKGFISELTDTTFLLTKGNDTFLVDYSGAAYDGTPQADLGISDLLALARDDHLLVRVSADAIDFGTDPYAVTGSQVMVVAEGTMDSLDDVARTFDLTYDSTSIAVDYGDAADGGRVEGTLADNANVDVTLFGYDSVDMEYLAHKVEVDD